MPVGGKKKVFVIDSFIQEIHLETLIQPITKDFINETLATSFNFFIFII